MGKATRIFPRVCLVVDILFCNNFRKDMSYGLYIAAN